MQTHAGGCVILSLIFSIVLFITSLALLFFSGFTFAKCQSFDVHCISVSGLSPLTPGKFIKIKKIGEFPSPYTLITCAWNGFSLSIPQLPEPYRYYKENQNITWDIAQCSDEDCGLSQSILNDTFIISKNEKNIYSSNPNRTEVILNSNYGKNCL